MPKIKLEKINLIQRDANFFEMELPIVLYKYRIWSNKLHQKTLINQELWLAAPSSFEDPLDCKIPLRYDLLTDQEIFSKYYDDSKKNNKNWNRNQHRSFAKIWTKNSPIKNPVTLRKHTETTFNEYDIRFGVLSLTANPVNMVMWDKYSDNHKGFTIGLDSKIALNYFGGGGEVNYVDELPIIMPTPVHNMQEQHVLQVFSKLRKWEFEEEYRVHKFSPNPMTNTDRTITLPKEAFKEILLGANISLQHKNEIINLSKEIFTDILIYQCEIIDNKIHKTLI